MLQYNQISYNAVFYVAFTMLLLCFSCNSTPNEEQLITDNQKNTTLILYVKEAKQVSLDFRKKNQELVYDDVDPSSIQHIQPSKYSYQNGSWVSMYYKAPIEVPYQEKLNQISPNHSDILVMPHIPTDGYLRPPLADHPDMREVYTFLLLEWQQLTSQLDSL